MIIKQLTLHNYAVYVGTNTYEFHNDKPVVLIGGKNGRGKTSFLTAVLLALFGQKSYAFNESSISTYSKYLQSFANIDHEGYDETYVEIVFEEEQEEKDTYTIRRSWYGNQAQTRERVKVLKNGEESAFLAKNWNLYIETIIPSALAPFFFFDGEIISEYAVDTESEQLKQSIKALLGITVLDQLENDIDKINSKAEKKIDAIENDKTVEKMKKERDHALSALEALDVTIETTKQELNDLQIELEQKSADYITVGGVVQEEYNNMIEKKAELNMLINHGQQKLIQLSATALPLYMVKDLLHDIEATVELEQDAKINGLTVQRMQSLYESYLKQNSDQNGVSDFIEYAKKVEAQQQQEQVYELPLNMYYRLVDLNKHELLALKEEMQTLRKEVKSYKNQLITVEDHLTIVVDENKVDKTLKQMGNLEARIEQLKKDLLVLEEQRTGLNGDYRKANSAYNKKVGEILETIENKDDNKRICSYSKKVKNVLDLYKERLQERKIQTLSKTATECFARLANKTVTITIYIDPKTLDIFYLDENGKEINKHGFSAGEKQLLVIAILWSLAICSAKKLPVIIDTPLSRMDIEHRNSIIQEYFPNASEQTIILSTDSEINEFNYHLIQEYVGDEYSLSFDDATKKSTILKGYRFGGVNDDSETN